MMPINAVLQLMRPSFRTVEFAVAQGRGRLYARQALHRLKKKKLVLGVMRGWWAKPDALPEQAAPIISYPAYLSFHSAIYLHQLTTQIPRTVQLAIARKAKKYSVMGTPVEEYGLPKGMFGGYEVKDGVPLAGAEKAFADCLKIPRACPLMVLAEAFPELDEGKILAFCTNAMKRRLASVKRMAARNKEGV